ncbi:mechanosensitive ion channel-like protein [Ulvibacter sp. MAR_2010_11]|uniref:mechanosensitive ion channel family protein n=1 Tax=Ulvibacter sp. MAR_2010_11 TaxID=1250229 RepID=UPI000C2BA7CD|nr:mechanosensitive ion channel family protein [Ulvibacter sp. MAR_2010_11]PKA81941.1 mechanosensitive ion channel-like protein [Ulvibacter sp. MAR_2010_11]
MSDFFTTHKAAIVYACVVIGIVALLVLITNLLHNWLAKKAKRKYPNEEPETIHLIRRIFRTLWVTLGISAISFIFIDENLYTEAQNNFFLIAYLGFVLIITIIGASVVQTLFARAIRKKTIVEGGDPTSYKFLRYLAIFAVYFIGALLAILAFPSLRGIAQTALGGAGILAVVAGVASQEALANLVGGVFIIAFKPFKINDVVKISETMVGTVTDITLRHTVIRNYENKMIVIPNSIINKEKVINYDLGERKCCHWIEIGISYDSDIDLAKNIMQQECENHPNILDNRTYYERHHNVPKVITRVIKLDESQVTLRAWAWASDFPTAFIMKCDLLESIKKRFVVEGIEIPFPHRTLVLKKEQLEVISKSMHAVE